MVDSCPSYFSGDQLFDIFMTNFFRHYDSNRAPMGLYFHSTWFKDTKNRKAFLKFVDEMVQRPDVWIVSSWEILQWMQNPTPQSQMNQFEPWKAKCDKPVPLEEQACSLPNVCKLFSRDLRKHRYLYTCEECPATYPWIKNEFGRDF